MRKVLGCLLAVGVSFGAQRAVLLEVFTSRTCPYCPSASIAADSLKRLYGDTLTVVNYVYGSSTGEYSVRFNYYGVEYVPTGWVDGLLSYTGGNPFNQYKSMIEQRKGVPSPVRIEDLNIEKRGDSGFVSVRVVLEEDLNPADSPRVFAAVTQRNRVAYYNGVVSDRTFRDMISSAYGDTLRVYSAGESQDFSWGFKIWQIWDDSLDIAVWVQYYRTKEVLQSAQAFAFTVGVREGAQEPRPSLLWLPEGLLLKGKGKFNLAVYDATGRLVLRREGALEGSALLPLGSLGKGLYVAVAEVGGELVRVTGVR